MNLEIVWQNTFSQLSRDLVDQFQQTFFYYVEKLRPKKTKKVYQNWITR